MIYAELSGGLGNQFFQYAMVRKLQLGTNEPVSFYHVSQKTSNETPRSASILKFNIDSSWSVCKSGEYVSKHKLVHLIEFLFDKVQIITKTKRFRFKYFVLNKLGRIKHSQHYYYPVEMETCHSDKFISGLWHHPMYFDSISDVLKCELTLKDISLVPTDILNQIKSSNSVAVHIRRGDYVKYPYYIVADINYYKNAISRMRELHHDATFFVFSDDIQWVKDNLDENVIFVDSNNPDYIDMELMRNCNHFIISNSTFSWWAAYLGRYADKTVMTPDKWYSDGRNKEWLNLPGWIVLKTGI